MKYLSVALFIASFVLFIAAIWVTDYWWQCLTSALVFFFAGDSLTQPPPTAPNLVCRRTTSWI